MEKLNELLRLHGDEFRLPKSVATFKERNSLQLFSAEGIKNYAVCSSCYDLTSIKKKPVITEMVCNRSLVGAIYKPTNSGEFCSGRIYDFENKSADAQLVVQMVYSYCSIITTLKKLFLRKGFADQVTAWKYYQPAREYLSDLYDATGFLDFKTSSDAPPFVLQSDYNLLLSLNIDWFSPFNTNHSVGCIYLTVQNLPKQQGRDMKRNMLLVGVIPGPREPPTTAINKYLAPMVEDLKVLLEGVQMKMIMQPRKSLPVACLSTAAMDAIFARLNSRCFLILSAGEIIATGIASNGNEEPLKRPGRAPRSGDTQELLKKEPSLAIEPMHVLYLGVAKKALKTMLPEGAFLEIKKILQEYVEFDPDGSCAPMAKKIVKEGFPFVKAAEYKDFMTSVAEHVLSPPLLNASDYDLIMHLINALRLLNCNVIKKTDVEVAHNHLLAFARGFEQRFGSLAVTPNFHFMLHLRECIYKFGPISCFWAFGFERNNMYRMQSIIFADDSDSVAHYIAR